MTNNEANEKYLEYLEGHIGNVKEAFDILCKLDIPFINENKNELLSIVSSHDESKYEEPEWSAYLHHFYPTCDEDSLKTEEEFEDAQDNIEGDMPIEGEPENREPTKLDELKQEEKELNTELVSKQMKMVALQKRLNDLNSNNAMEDMIKGE